MHDSKQTLVRYIAIITDILTMFAVYLVANYIKFGNFRTGLNNPQDYYLGVFTTSLIFYIIVYFFIPSRESIIYRNWIQEVFDVVKMEIYIIALTVGYFFITQTSWYYSRVQMAIYFGGSIVCVIITRQILKRFILKSYHRSGSNEKIMLVTTYDQVSDVMNKIKQTRNWYFRISNLAIVDKNVVGEELEGLEVVANCDNLIQIASTSEIDTVFFHVDDEVPLDYKGLISQIRSMGKNVRVRLKEYSYAHGNRELEFLGNFAVATFSSRHYRIRYVAIKRIFDIVCAIVGMMIFIPMYFIMAIGLFIEGDPGSVIVQTLRVGKNGRRFYMLRFRTLRKKGIEAGAGNGIPQYTIMGRFIKALGMENLPNAWNILWDNMSVVGVNAPTLPEFLEYSHKNRNVMSMKPGMIGLWQVQRKHFTKEQSDENYVDNWSLFMDLIGLFIEGDPGSVIVQTLRVGKNGRRFYMLRFRTLRKKGIEAGAGNGIPQYTIMGRFIKALGMENLPNAWNILWDNMSVVGVNAPTLPEFLEYSHKNRNVMSMKPGMIGLWQVQRKHFTKEQSDENYVDNWSLFMDLGIIVKSLKLFFTK